MIISLPLWMEVLAHLLSDTRNAYVERLYRKITLTDGKKGVSSSYLRKILCGLQVLGLVKRGRDGLRKPFSLTEKGIDAASHISELKRLLKDCSTGDRYV